MKKIITLVFLLNISNWLTAEAWNYSGHNDNSKNIVTQELGNGNSLVLAGYVNDVLYSEWYFYGIETTYFFRHNLGLNLSLATDFTSFSYITGGPKWVIKKPGSTKRIFPFIGLQGGLSFVTDYYIEVTSSATYPVYPIGLAIQLPFGVEFMPKNNLSISFGFVPHAPFNADAEWLTQLKAGYRF